MNLAQLLNASALSYPDRPAMKIGGDCYQTYSDMARAAAGLADHLRDGLGLGQGARVLLAMTNNPDYLTCLFACWQAGLVAVPINAKLHPAEIAYIAHDSDSQLSFVSHDLAADLRGVLPDLPMIEIGTDAYRAAIAAPASPIAETAPEDTAWIFYTSGTTGRPKGALLSHRNLQTMALTYLADVDQLTPEDSLLHLAATSHASGLFGLSFIAKAGANILPPSGGYDPEEMAQIIAGTPRLTFFAPSTLLNRMAADPAIRAAPLQNIRTILTGAGPIYLEDLKGWLAAFGPKIWNGYGQGETPCTITALPKYELWSAYQRGDEARMASVGIARSGVEVRLIGADGRPVAPGEVGEVTLRADTVMSGYLNQPEASAEGLRGGWLHTGDLAKVDARGFYTLLDRKKDVIITGGMNVYAREVEEVLLTHPQIAECAVIGVKDPDWGEAIVALIVPTAEALPPPDPAQMDALCLSHLARFKRPKRYEIVTALPKNAAGKVLKAELRARLSAAAST